MVIDISVKFRFSISSFPVSIEEIFIVIKQVFKELGKTLVIELLKKLEEKRVEQLKARGFVRSGTRNRKFNGVLGEITLKLIRMKRGKMSPYYVLADLVSWPAHVRYTDDNFEVPLGTLPHLSYRRSCKESERVVGHSPSKSSLHRRLQTFETMIRPSPLKNAKGYRFLFVDGTGAKFQKCIGMHPRRIKTYRSELRMVYASKGVHKPLKLIGCWSNTDWYTIAHETYKRIDPSCLEYLISDGEVGIDGAFMKSHMKHQRCSVHAWRELAIFMYLDGAKKAEQEPFKKVMKTMPVFKYDKETLEKLKKKDAVTVKKAVRASTMKLSELQNLLEQKGYQKTATYIENLKKPLIEFLKHWLKTGEAMASTSNLAENRFSLIKNRIRTGRRWSEEGLQRWVKLAVHKIFPGYNWETLWNRIIPQFGNISCKIVEVYS